MGENEKLIIPEDVATEEWLRLLRLLLAQGNQVNPRDQASLELLNYSITIPMTAPIVLSQHRALGYKFMAAEAAWILSGDNRVDTIAPYAKHIKEFSDDGVRFFGAYGPPVRDQLGHVIKTLSHDLSSRQAVLTLWRPNPPLSRDIPCTIALQWMIRGGQLHCFATMRSSDAWLGVPYDWFNFSMISLAVLLELSLPDVRLGDLYFTAASEHLYLRNKNRAETCVTYPYSMTAPRLDPWSVARDTDSLVKYLWGYANGQT